VTIRMLAWVGAKPSRSRDRDRMRRSMGYALG
jgi:hypothetical protein